MPVYITTPSSKTKQHWAGGRVLNDSKSQALGGGQTGVKTVFSRRDRADTFMNSK